MSLHPALKPGDGLLSDTHCKVKHFILTDQFFRAIFFIFLIAVGGVVNNA